MVKHYHDGEEWWCLPGGGIEPGEAPDVAALRELREECCVSGRLVKLTSIVEYGENDRHYTYLVEIGEQAPSLGFDPEIKEGETILNDVGWLSLPDLSEADRVYLWTAGLLSIPVFANDLLMWDRKPVPPPTKQPDQTQHSP